MFFSIGNELLLCCENIFERGGIVSLNLNVARDQRMWCVRYYCVVHVSWDDDNMRC